MFHYIVVWGIVFRQCKPQLLKREGESMCVCVCVWVLLSLHQVNCKRLHLTNVLTCSDVLLPGSPFFIPLLHHQHRHTVSVHVSHHGVPIGVRHQSFSRPHISPPSYPHAHTHTHTHTHTLPNTHTHVRAHTQTSNTTR